MNGENYSARGSRQLSDRQHGSRDDRRGGDRDRDRDRPRRRSRSPHGGGGRGRGDYEADSYSSSRGYRDREREDRYGGRDRRDGGGRDWDRSGGYGRRDRRDDGPRGGPRDRDLFEDRRGGGRRGGDEMARQAKRSPTPPRKPKEPTPDLTDIVSVLERRRRLTQWDIKPQGYENISAEQAKLSGMFPLPGAPRQQAMDLSRLQAFMKEPQNAATGAALAPSNSRQAKRMVVSNIPKASTDEQLRDFFNLNLNGLNVVSGKDPCVSAHVAKDKSFALLEFRNAEDATLSLALDGLEIEDSHANGSNGDANGLESGLQIKRPKDYIAPSKSEDTEVIEGQVSGTVPDTPNKIVLTRVPIFIDEEQVKELVSAFGALKSFVLVKDNETGSSKGVAFCEYVDAAGITDTAIEALHGMELGDSKIKLARACVGASQVSSEMNVSAMSMLAGTETADQETSRVLCLYNMVTADELIDNDEYEEICEDVREECSKFGEIIELKVPRPSGGSRQANGVGKIYIKYENNDASAKALRALAGRRFADRTVVTSYFGEEYFDVNAW